MIDHEAKLRLAIDNGPDFRRNDTRDRLGFGLALIAVVGFVYLFAVFVFSFS